MQVETLSRCCTIVACILCTVVVLDESFAQRLHLGRTTREPQCLDQLVALNTWQRMTVATDVNCTPVL
jgi:hypothetical protein